MKKYILPIILFLAVLAAAFVFIFETRNAKQAEVCIKDNCFKVKLAVSLQEKERGLMFEKNLALNEGMFFVFEKEGDYSFWMKNMLIPLDIIWINKNREVVFIKENAEPCINDDCFAIIPNSGAMYVLEINSGLADKFGFEIGNKAVVKGP
jgi:uncharacterized protein